MAATCVNINNPEYQDLVKRSGTSEVIVKALSRKYLDLYGRYPYLDEIPTANSELNLKEFINIRNNGSSTVTDILNATGTDSILSATVSLNDTHRDLKVKLTPLNKEVIVDILHKPTEEVVNELFPEMDTNVNSQAFLTLAIGELALVHGIQIIPVTIEQLMSDKWKHLPPSAKNINAFIYNGNIYVNTDVANVDAPLHEMLHIFVGSLKSTNPLFYLEMLDSVTKFLRYEDLVKLYPNRTRNDVNEELLVREVSRHLTGQISEFDNINDASRYEILYNVDRMLDTLLMGEHSTRSIPRTELLNMSMKSIALKVHSTAMNNSFMGSMDQASIHRVLANLKGELIKSGDLKEYCI